MLHNESPLKVVKFDASLYDVSPLAERLTDFKALASRTPTPVTVDQLTAISESKTGALLLQVAEEGDEQLVVGMVYVGVSYLEDRALIGPIAIDPKSTPRGHGTPLMEAAIDYAKKSFPSIRRIDLTNRPSHDLEAWYGKFGFKGRTEANSDPTTVYRLTL